MVPFTDGIRLGELAPRLDQMDLVAVMGETPVLVFRPGKDHESPLFVTPDGGEELPLRNFQTDTSPFGLGGRAEVKSPFANSNAVAVPVTKSNRNPETDDEIVTVGRGRTNDVRLVSGLVSKKHATIRLADRGGWQITDEGSANGTFVNGLRLEAHRDYFLRPSDELEFGDVVGVFLDANGLVALCRMVGR